MAATLKGRAIGWSINGFTFGGTITAVSFPQSIRFSRGSEKTEIKDDGGVIRTQVFHGFKKMLSVTVVPADAAGSLAGAQTSIDGHNLTPGTTITIATAPGAIIDASPATYNLINATVNRTVDGAATVDMELEQGDEGTDLTSAVS